MLDFITLLSQWFVKLPKQQISKNKHPNSSKALKIKETSLSLAREERPLQGLVVRTSRKLSAFVAVQKASILLPTVSDGDNNATNLELLLEPEYYTETMQTYKLVKLFLEKHPSFQERLFN